MKTAIVNSPLHTDIHGKKVFIIKEYKHENRIGQIFSRYKTSLNREAYIHGIALIYQNIH